MFERNLDVRKEKGKIPLWVIAERLNVSENTLRAWLRKEMEAARKANVMTVISEIKMELREYEVTKIIKDSQPV